MLYVCYLIYTWGLRSIERLSDLFKEAEMGLEPRESGCGGPKVGYCSSPPRESKICQWKGKLPWFLHCPVLLQDCRMLPERVWALLLSPPFCPCSSSSLFYGPPHQAAWCKARTFSDLPPFHAAPERGSLRKPAMLLISAVDSRLGPFLGWEKWKC